MLQPVACSRHKECVTHPLPPWEAEERPLGVRAQRDCAPGVIECLKHVQRLERV
jgi:hypothetical protein